MSTDSADPVHLPGLLAEISNEQYPDGMSREEVAAARAEKYRALLNLRRRKKQKVFLSN